MRSRPAMPTSPSTKSMAGNLHPLLEQIGRIKDNALTLERFRPVGIVAFAAFESFEACF